MHTKKTFSVRAEFSENDLILKKYIFSISFYFCNSYFI